MPKNKSTSETSEQPKARPSYSRDPAAPAKAKTWQLPTDRIPLETEEQQDFVRWFRQTYRPVRILAVPNGVKRAAKFGGAIQGNKQRNQGVASGVPDLYVPEWKLWIEMKRTDGGHVDPDQVDWHAYLTEQCGDTVIVGYGSADAQAKVALIVGART